MSEHGMRTLASRWSVGVTIERLHAIVTHAGLQVFARIDHATNATEAGMELRPTELLIFGNPRGGTPLMQDRQTSGIDLPVKALAWQDEDGNVWLTYNTASWLAGRHGLREPSGPAIDAIEAGLHNLANEAVGTNAIALPD